MVKFVLDSDAAIKLARSGVLAQVASFAKCYMTNQVYAEILKGKEKDYEDAFIVKSLVDLKKIKLCGIKLEGINIAGLGENSTLKLFRKVKADAILSDDKRFLSVLEDEEIKFIIPTDIIVMLALKRKISKSKAIKALDNLRYLVSEENYQAAKEMLGGE